MANPPRHLLSPSIRRNLQFLVLAAFLPGIAILLFTVHALQDSVVKEVEAYTLRQVQSIAAHHDQVLEENGLLLPTTKTNAVGINLSTVKRIATEHQGELGVSSQVGQGTTFTLNIPLAPDEPREVGRA